MTIRIVPTTWMSMPASVAVTAKRRIAPTAIRKRLAPRDTAAPFHGGCVAQASASTAGRQRVDGDGDREDQRHVLVGRDVDPVGLAHTEPLLRDRGHGIAVALDLVLVVDDVP